MRLRGRTVGDVEDDEPSVVSTSSRSMDENSSIGAVLGSPVTRRSWSTTHDSQESSHNPAPVATNAAHPSSTDQPGYESDPQQSREQHPYLTDYETATYTEHEVYPTTILDSQGDLYNTSPPQTQTQTHHPEEPPAYVQTTSPPAMTYGPTYITNNPQTPTQSQLRTDNRPNPYYTPHSATPTQPALQHTSITSHSHQTPIPQLPARSVDYGEPANGSYFNYEQPPHAYPHPRAFALTAFPPFQSHQLHDHAEAPSYLHTPASEPLNRYVTSDNEESWSPATQTHPETHKRRISEADETVDGFRHNKMMTELDEIEERGEGSQTQGTRKRRRRRRGSGKGKGRSRPRSRSRSRDRDNGDGKGRNRGGDGGSGEGMRS